MIVLDTNVLSEPLKPEPDPRVVAWLDAQHVETLCVITLTLAELRYGVAALPEGRRRQVLVTRFEKDLVPLFSDASSASTLRPASRTPGSRRELGQLVGRCRPWTP